MLAIDGADRLMEVQENSWSRGDFITVEELLAQNYTMPVTQRELLRLVLNELSLRSYLSSEESTSLLVREYTRRFPQIAEQIEIDQEIVQIAEEFLRAEVEPPKHLGHSQAVECQTSLPELANYRITGKIDAGGFGTIYHARQLVPDREVAIKVLHQRCLPFNDELSTHSEADNIVRLRHPNIIEIYEVGVIEGLAYYTMPYMSQGNLDRRIEDYRDRFVMIAQLMIDVCRAVTFANQFHLLHCDLKPSNILMDDNKPLVADFGLAFRTDRDSAHSARGTFAYMAPEQRPGASRPLTCQTDVYGVGAILFRLLCGSPPGDCQVALPDGQIEVKPSRQVNPRVPADLNAIAAKCLRNEPDQRYGSVGEVADELQRYIDHRPLMVRPLTGWRLPLRLVKWVRRAPALATFLATLAIAFVVVLGQNRRLETALADSEVQRVVAASTLTAHGDLVFERSTRPQAEPKYRNSMRLYQQLVKSYPHKLDYRLMLATTQSRLASLYLELGKHPEALDLLNVATDTLTEIGKRTDAPDKAQDELANAHAALGKYYFRQIDRARALSEFAMAQQLRLALAKSTPDRLDRAFAVAMSAHEVGLLLSETSGQSTRAIQSLEDAIAQMEKVMAKLPSGSVAIAKSRVNDDVGDDAVDVDIELPNQMDVALRLQQAVIALANFHLSNRQLAQAEAIYVGAEKRWTALLAQEPNVWLYQDFYASINHNLGTCRIDAGKFPEAVECLQQAEAAFERLLKSLGTSIPTSRRLAKCKSELARACFNQLRAANPAFLESPPQPEALKNTRKLAFEKAGQALECLANNPVTEPSNEDHVEVALIEKLLGDLEFDAGAEDTSAMERAGKHYERALKNMELVDSLSLTLALQRLDLLNNVCRLCIDSGQFDQALVHLRSGIELAETLQRENPKHVGVITARILFRDAEGLVETHIWGRLPPEAQQAPAGIARLQRRLECFDEVLALERMLGSDKIEEPSMQNILMGVRARRALALDELGRYEDSIAQWESLLNAPGGDALDVYRLVLGCTYGKSGDFQAMEREFKRAMPAVQQQVEDPEMNLACMYTLVAVASLHNDKLTLAERQARHSEYTQRAIALLLDAKERGFFESAKNRDSLKQEKNLDHLRALPAFQKLFPAVE